MEQAAGVVKGGRAAASIGDRRPAGAAEIEEIQGRTGRIVRAVDDDGTFVFRGSTGRAGVVEGNFPATVIVDGGVAGVALVEEIQCPVFGEGAVVGDGGAAPAGN